MAFTIDIKKGKGYRGRSAISSGVQFFHHPDSAFQPQSPIMEVSPTPTLYHSRRTTAPPTLPLTPADPAGRVPDAPSPNMAHSLNYRLSQEQFAEATRSLSPQLDAISLSSGNMKEDDTPIRQEKKEPSPQHDPGSHQSPSQGLPAPLVLVDYLYSGNIWDFWQAEHPTFGTVVLKIVYLENPPCIDPYYGEYIAHHEIIDHAMNEEEILMGPLKDLQGTVVPKYYGIYQSEPTGRFRDPKYLAMILEFIGDPLGLGFVGLKEDWQAKLFEAYKQIHLRGVIHEDLSGHHILYDEASRIRLVSFRRSYVVDVKDFSDVLSLVEEASVVRYRLGSYDWRTMDAATVIPPEYWAQVPDPVNFPAAIKWKV